MIRNDDYFEIIKEQNKELAKFRPFTSAYEMKKEIERLHSIVKEVRETLNTQLAFTSSYQLNYQSAMNIIEEAKGILDKVGDKE